MSDLIAIGYQDETTALEARDEVGQLSKELVIEPDAVAAIVRNKEGKLKDAERELRQALHGETAAV